MDSADLSDGYIYADPDVEKSLRLQFREDRKEVTTVQRTVQQKIKRLSLRLGAEESPIVRMPQKGFLKRKPNQHQRAVLADHLGPKYAAHLATQQTDLASIPIDESDEEMVHLPGVIGKRADYTLNTYGFHDACGPYAREERIFWLRSEVAHKVATLFAALSEIGLRAHVEDCWRPPQVQEGLYIRRLITIAKQTDWDWEQVRNAARSLTAPAPGFAGHQAGAAIDWRLCKQTSSRKPEFLDLGNSYPQGGAVASLYYPYVTARQWETRQIFEHACRMGGFKLLLSEDWHASLGDRGLGQDGKPQEKAFYGPVKNFSRGHGKPTQRYDAAEIDRDFLTGQEHEAVVDFIRQHADPDARQSASVQVYDEEEFRRVITLLRQLDQNDHRKRLEGWFKTT